MESRVRRKKVVDRVICHGEPGLAVRQGKSRKETTGDLEQINKQRKTLNGVRNCQERYCSGSSFS